MDSLRSPLLQRSFRDLSNGEVADIEKNFSYTRFTKLGSFGWDELYRYRRILIVSEAGAGKTYECQTQRRKLWNAGEPAFFLDLSTLAVSSVREMLSGEEEERFDAWLRSQSELATFFLDSIDELKLTLGKFDQALKRLSKAIVGQLGRARIIITSRPIPIDRELIAEHLPIPTTAKALPTASAFADIVMRRTQDNVDEDVELTIWRNVYLLPFSYEQIREFAVLQGVRDPDAFLENIKKLEAGEFAERPQDLIELCADWKEYRRVRSHYEQVDTNIVTKLSPNVQRIERSELSLEAAIEGASRLALAAILTRKLTLRYSSASDALDQSDATLNVSKILQDWSLEAKATLLERPLFGFATYGRVRFHHRSVVEYLAAYRLNDLLNKGASIKSVKRLLFVETAQGMRRVRPRMQAVASWLSLWRDTIFEEVVKCDPAVVLNNADPQSLRPSQRIKALEAYALRYGQGGWRGLSVPRMQVHRLACHELGAVINALWTQRIENEEVRDLLLQIIGAGKLYDCSDVAYASAMDPNLSIRERSLAIEALVQLGDTRLSLLVASIQSDVALWPMEMARHALLDLFPTYMPIADLSKILHRVREHPGGIGDLTYRLPRAIEFADVSFGYLNELRKIVTNIIIDGMIWDKTKFPHLRTQRPDLISALTAISCRLAKENIQSREWVFSAQLAIRLLDSDRSERDSVAELREVLDKLPDAARELAFWEEDVFLNKLYQPKDMWHRVFELVHRGGLRLNFEKDGSWVRRILKDQNEPLERREMMLWVELLVFRRPDLNDNQLLEELRPVVSDSPVLSRLIAARLEVKEQSAELRRLQVQNEKLTKRSERRSAKARASWISFWEEVVRDPNAVFSKNRATNTAWNLWNAMARAGEKSQASGWNRRFIEEQFGKDIADRLRQVMKEAWRKDRPTLRSERAEGEKDTYLNTWLFGLAGIAAEAEDVNWANRLSEQEAALACRYAPLELNGFPSWLEELAAKHPAAVDQILGNELTLNLLEERHSNKYSIFLQNISHASSKVSSLFIPRIRNWVRTVVQDRDNGISVFSQTLSQGVEILIRNGDDDDRRFLEEYAVKALNSDFGDTSNVVWLRSLFDLNVAVAIDILENQMNGSAVSGRGAEVQLLGELFNNNSHGVGVNLQSDQFSPSDLLRLLRLFYRHVRVEDDASHEGPYSPDFRDNAEQARNAIFNALLSTTGQEGWRAKLELASDPLFASLKDRIVLLAEEKAAEEADSLILTEKEFLHFDKTGEAPPTTNEAMFMLMRDRLDDIDDLLLQDVSPRELWSNIKDEYLMRRELARTLREAGGRTYTVDQEAVTGKEHETDIRLRSTTSKLQAVIELKLGERWSAKALLDTIRDQLLTKYMAADECRAGCLVVTLSKNRTWLHPVTGTKIKFDELIAILHSEAARLTKELGGSARIMVKGFDLRS